MSLCESVAGSLTEVLQVRYLPTLCKCRCLLVGAERDTGTEVDLGENEMQQGRRGSTKRMGPGVGG